MVLIWSRMVPKWPRNLIVIEMILVLGVIEIVETSEGCCTGSKRRWRLVQKKEGSIMKLFPSLWNMPEKSLLENSSLKLNNVTWNYWVEIGATERRLTQQGNFLHLSENFGNCWWENGNLDTIYFSLQYLSILRARSKGETGNSFLKIFFL